MTKKGWFKNWLRRYAVLDFCMVVMGYATYEFASLAVKVCSWGDSTLGALLFITSLLYFMVGFAAWTVRHILRLREQEQEVCV